MAITKDMRMAKQKYLNNSKGFTLVECLIVLVIIGILSPLMGKFMINFAKMQSKLSKTTAPIAQSLIAKVTPIANACTKIDGIYYGKTNNNDDLYIYTNSSCTQSLGTLNRFNNPSWFNETTFTDWLVYSINNILKVRLVKYTKGD